MNAQDILNTLLQLQMAGVDLNELELVTICSSYNYLGQCELVESYPAEIVVNDNQVVIQ
jgi:hypothetical protein